VNLVGSVRKKTCPRSRYHRVPGKTEVALLASIATRPKVRRWRWTQRVAPTAGLFPRHRIPEPCPWIPIADPIGRFRNACNGPMPWKSPSAPIATMAVKKIAVEGAKFCPLSHAEFVERLGSDAVDVLKARAMLWEIQLASPCRPRGGGADLRADQALLSRFRGPGVPGLAVRVVQPGKRAIRIPRPDPQPVELDLRRTHRLSWIDDCRMTIDQTTTRPLAWALAETVLASMPAQVVHGTRRRTASPDQSNSACP